MAPTNPPADPAPMKFSKRQFLTGAVAGMCVFQGGRWVAAASSHPEAEEKHAVSYAQAGEDLVVGMIFDYLKMQVRSYIDIGAADPVKINNTYLFYRCGARGVLVEPNPDMTARLREKRPRDTVLPVGIGVTSEREADFYRTTESTWNTFDRDTAEGYARSTGGKVTIKEVIKVPLLNINEVFAEHFAGQAPDFVSLDVEGFEVPILKSLDFGRYRPKVFCVETLVAGTTGQKLEAVEFLTGKGYVARGSTFANTIMVDKKLL